MFFDTSSDNEKIKHIYGNYGFWSWLRYWYIDTANQVTMMLVDKGYYDYDFEAKNEKFAQALFEDTVKTEEQTRDILAIFGIGKRKEESIDEIQELAMNEIEKS